MEAVEATPAAEVAICQGHQGTTPPIPPRTWEDRTFPPRRRPPGPLWRELRLRGRLRGREAEAEGEVQPPSPFRPAGPRTGGGPPAAAAAAAAAAATAEQGFQPAALAQRARAGCALAWEYVVQVDPEAARAAAGAGAGGGAVGPSRRSGRQRGAAGGGGGGGDEDGDWDGLPRPPSGQEQGGRVALQLLGELGYLPGHGGEGDEEDAMEEEDDADEEEDEEEEEEDEEEEDDDDDDEEEHSATIDPAFLPTPAEIVHHLGRLQRSVQPRDVQDAIVRAVTLGMETPEFVLEHGREVRRQRRLAGMADRRRKRKKGRGGGGRRRRRGGVRPHGRRRGRDLDGPLRHHGGQAV